MVAQYIQLGSEISFNGVLFAKVWCAILMEGVGIQFECIVEFVGKQLEKT